MFFKKKPTGKYLAIGYVSYDTLKNNFSMVEREYRRYINELEQDVNFCYSELTKTINKISGELTWKLGKNEKTVSTPEDCVSYERWKKEYENDLGIKIVENPKIGRTGSLKSKTFFSFNKKGMKLFNKIKDGVILTEETQINLNEIVELDKVKQEVELLKDIYGK